LEDDTPQFYLLKYFFLYFHFTTSPREKKNKKEKEDMHENPNSQVTKKEKRSS